MPSTSSDILRGPAGHERPDPGARPRRAKASAVSATRIGDTELVRLLAAWSDAAPGRPAPPVVEALGRWLHWTDAIALSEALGRRPPARAAFAEAGALQAEVARRRAALAAALADDAELHAELNLPGATPEAVLAACRRHLAERQRALEAGVAVLRTRLRAALTARGGDGARLAAVDQVLAEALGRRERVLLAAMPSLLAHRQQALAAGAQPADALCAELRQLLLAELDLRLQPVLGLLAAIQPAGAGAAAP